jgi:hypothetical protein
MYQYYPGLVDIPSHRETKAIDKVPLSGVSLLIVKFFNRYFKINITLVDQSHFISGFNEFAALPPSKLPKQNSSVRAGIHHGRDNGFR